MIQENYKIGIVLAGGMSKGAYELGCLRAIEEYFGKENITCLSASSIGTLVGYAFLTGKTHELLSLWQTLEPKKGGRFFPGLTRNPEILKRIRQMICDNDLFPSQFYITLWNFLERKAEYVALQDLNAEKKQEYITAAINIPVINKGIHLGEKVYFDGAFLDNIPVYPMLKSDVDFIFCIYFDRQTYLFENKDFDRKVIKMNRFPLRSRLIDDYIFKPEQLECMINYGYDYGKEIIERIFSDSDKEIIYDKIVCEAPDTSQKMRCTSDMLLTNINRVTSMFSKRKIL